MMKRNCLLASLGPTLLALAVCGHGRPAAGKGPPVETGPEPSSAGGKEITINDTMVMPESLTSSQDGTVFFGSTRKGTIYRALPGAAQADAWIQGAATGLTNVFGVLADEKSNTLKSVRFSGQFFALVILTNGYMSRRALLIWFPKFSSGKTRDGSSGSLPVDNREIPWSKLRGGSFFVHSGRLHWLHLSA